MSAKLSAKATAKSGCSSHEKKKQLQQQEKKVAVAARYNNNISCAVTKNHSIKSVKKK